MWGVYKAISEVFVVCRQGRKKVGRCNPLTGASVRCVTYAANASDIVAIRRRSSPGVKHDPAVGLYNHTLFRMIVAFPSAPIPTPGQDISVFLCPLSPCEPACRLSSRSQRLPASFDTRHHPQTGPTVPLPVLAVFPKSRLRALQSGALLQSSAANRHSSRLNASCSLSCQRPGSR